jgi:hypothetical protein
MHSANFHRTGAFENITPGQQIIADPTECVQIARLAEDRGVANQLAEGLSLLLTHVDRFLYFDHMLSKLASFATIAFIRCSFQNDLVDEDAPESFSYRKPKSCHD